MKTMSRFASLLALITFATVGVTLAAEDAAKGTVVRVDAKVEVGASSMSGAKFVAPESGTYRLKILSGAFCYLPQQPGQSSPYDGWLTQVQFYTKAVSWGSPDEWGKHPVGAAGSLGDGSHQSSRAAAAAAGLGASATVQLEKGQTLTLLVSDGSEWYGDNEGSVKVGITAEIVLPAADETTPAEDS